MKEKNDQKKGGGKGGNAAPAAVPSPPTPDPSPSFSERYPAVVRYVARTGHKVPNDAIAERIQAVVGLDPPALARWDEVLDAWLMAGYNRRNIAGLLDWFTGGIPARVRPAGAGSGTPPAPLAPEARALAEALQARARTGAHADDDPARTRDATRRLPCRP